MRITKQTQIAMGGGDRQTFAYDLVQNEARKRILKFTHTANGVTTPIDITNHTFECKVIERIVDYVGYKNGSIDIPAIYPKPGAVAIDITEHVVKIDAVNGLLQFYLPNDVTVLEPVDPDTSAPIVYTGYLLINDNASVAPLMQKIQILIVVSNDGV